MVYHTTGLAITLNDSWEVSASPFISPQCIQCQELSSNNRLVGSVLWLFLHCSWNLDLLESRTMIIFFKFLIFFLPSVIVGADKVWSISLTACEISWCLQLKINSLSLRVQHSSILILGLTGSQSPFRRLHLTSQLISSYNLVLTVEHTFGQVSCGSAMRSCVMISSSWLIRVICVYCVGSYCR